ncbi:MAG: hypothetical protein K2Q15_11265, partial [Burkholderiales bacterium]|nr:hypothetical protein [Burkholderiales bacterium]
MQGQICTLRQVSGSSKASSGGDLRFKLSSKAPIAPQARYRVGTNWHRIGEEIGIAEFAQSRAIELFTPAKQAAPLGMQTNAFQGEFYSLARRQNRDQFSFEMLKVNYQVKCVGGIEMEYMNSLSVNGTSLEFSNTWDCAGLVGNAHTQFESVIYIDREGLQGLLVQDLMRMQVPKKGGSVAADDLNLNEVDDYNAWRGYNQSFKMKPGSPNSGGWNGYNAELSVYRPIYLSKKLKHFYQIILIGVDGSPKTKEFPANYEASPLFLLPDQAVTANLPVPVETGKTAKVLIPVDARFFAKTHKKSLWFKPNGTINSHLAKAKVIFSNSNSVDINLSAASEVLVPNGVTSASIEVTAKAGVADKDLVIDVSSVVDSSITARKITVNVKQGELVKTVGSVNAFLGIEASLPVTFKSELPAGSKIYTNLDKSTTGMTDKFQFCLPNGQCSDINSYSSVIGTITLAAKASGGLVKIKPKANFNVSPVKLYMSTRNVLEDTAMPSGVIMVSNPQLEVAEITSESVTEGAPLPITVKLKNSVVIDQKIRLKFVPGTAVFDEINPVVAAGIGFDAFTLKNNDYADVLIKKNTQNITFNIATKAGVGGNKDKHRSFQIAAKGGAGLEKTSTQTLLQKELIQSVDNADASVGVVTSISVVFKEQLVAGTVIYTNLDKSINEQVDLLQFCPENGSCSNIIAYGSQVNGIPLQVAAARAVVKIKPKAGFDLSLSPVKLYISTLNYREEESAAAGMPSGTMTFKTNPPVIEFTSSSSAKRSLFELGSPPVELDYAIRLSNMTIKSLRPLNKKDNRAYLQQRMASAFGIKAVLTGTDSVTVNGLKYCAFKKDASLIPTPLTA